MFTISCNSTILLMEEILQHLECKRTLQLMGWTTYQEVQDFFHQQCDCLAMMPLSLPAHVIHLIWRIISLKACSRKLRRGGAASGKVITSGVEGGEWGHNRLPTSSDIMDIQVGIWKSLETPFQWTVRPAVFHPGQLRSFASCSSGTRSAQASRQRLAVFMLV